MLQSLKTSPAKAWMRRDDDDDDAVMTKRRRVKTAGGAARQLPSFSLFAPFHPFPRLFGFDLLMPPFAALAAMLAAMARLTVVAEMLALARSLTIFATCPVAMVAMSALARTRSIALRTRRLLTPLSTIRVSWGPASVFGPVRSGFNALKRVLQRRDKNLASVVLCDFRLFDERDGGDERLDCRSVITRRCVLHGSGDGVGRDLFVPLQMLFHFRFGHRRRRGSALIPLRRPRETRRKPTRRPRKAHGRRTGTRREWWDLRSWGRARNGAGRDARSARRQECRVDVGLRGAGSADGR